MSPLPSQPPSDANLPFRGKSWWIWSDELSHEALAADKGSPSHYQVRRFRLRFRLNDESVGNTLVHVSADSRYLFYCNGALIGRGPAKGDVHHHFYDTFDLAPYLREGENVLAALVIDMSRVAHSPAHLGAPCSVMTQAGGFLLEGKLASSQGEIDLSTGVGNWQVMVDRAHRFQNRHTRFEGYHGYFEERHDVDLPRDWLTPGESDKGWTNATKLYGAERIEDRRDPKSPYGLMPRIIPQLEEAAPVRFTDGFVEGGGTLPDGWAKLLRGDLPAQEGVTLAANSVTAVILDAGSITTGYPMVEVSGGAGSEIEIIYAEALRLPWGTPDATLLGRQQELENLASHFAEADTGWTFDRRGTIHGWCDVWRPAGGVTSFSPLHWRCFRFVGLRIRTGDEPLSVRRIAHQYSAYPYKVAANFACSESRWEKIWDAGLRTMQLCSHETFEDCPHYEQMQYAGDTMITSHLGMLTTGDYRLSKQALLHFDWSRITDGLTASRYPSRLLQVIPSWSLHWITAVRDYGLCSGDLELVKELLPGIRAVLAWFGRHADANGLPARLPYWNMTDWCPWWPRGVVPGSDEGPTCIISSQYVRGLDELGEMCGWLDLRDEAHELKAKADRLRRQIHETFWSEAEGLYFDRPGGPEVSQYGNAWAVICGAADAATRQRLTQRFPDDAALAPGTFFSWHFSWEAMRRLGTYQHMPRYLAPWHESIDLGLDTFVEENSYWRSLCHAWSAHPILDFVQQVLGIKATAPGFASVRIQPNPCGLQWARGSVCTPRGPVRVDWKQNDHKFELVVESPAGCATEIVLPDGSIHQSTGGVWSSGQTGGTGDVVA